MRLGDTSTEVRHREVFFHQLQGLNPKSVLDVGCGQGKLLKRCVAVGIKARGIDPDPAHVKECAALGLDASQGVAEDLAFSDSEFEVIASEFSAHHYRDLRLFFKEAVRVARCGIVMLDAWYDQQIPAHRVAARLDTWSKRIDRDNGEVHNDVSSGQDFLSAMPEGWTGHHNIIYQVTDEMVAERDWSAQIDDQLARSRDPARDQPVAEKINAEARHFGVGAEGALVLTIQWG